MNQSSQELPLEPGGQTGALIYVSLQTLEISTGKVIYFSHVFHLCSCDYASESLIYVVYVALSMVFIYPVYYAFMF